MKVNISRLIRDHETFNRGLLGEFPFGIGRGQIDIAGKNHQLHFSWVHPQYRVLRWVNDHNEALFHHFKTAFFLIFFAVVDSVE